MEYKRFGNTIFARIDKGEEVLEQVFALAEKEHVTLGHISALGATDDFTVGVLDPNTKEYRPNEFKGPHEIVSLTGTVTERGGRPYLHLHMSAGNGMGQVVGGHLNRCVVSVTCELVLTVAEGHVGRCYDEELGINRFDFT